MATAFSFAVPITPRAVYNGGSTEAEPDVAMPMLHEKPWTIRELQRKKDSLLKEWYRGEDPLGSVQPQHNIPQSLYEEFVNLRHFLIIQQQNTRSLAFSTALPSHRGRSRDRLPPKQTPRRQRVYDPSSGSSVAADDFQEAISDDIGPKFTSAAQALVGCAASFCAVRDILEYILVKDADIAVCSFIASRKVLEAKICQVSLLDGMDLEWVCKSPASEVTTESITFSETMRCLAEGCGVFPDRDERFSKIVQQIRSLLHVSVDWATQITLALLYRRRLAGTVTYSFESGKSNNLDHICSPFEAFRLQSHAVDPSAITFGEVLGIFRSEMKALFDCWTLLGSHKIEELCAGTLADAGATNSIFDKSNTLSAAERSRSRKPLDLQQASIYSPVIKPINSPGTAALLRLSISVLAARLLRQGEDSTENQWHLVLWRAYIASMSGGQLFKLDETEEELESSRGSCGDLSLPAGVLRRLRFVFLLDWQTALCCCISGAIRSMSCANPATTIPAAFICETHEFLLSRGLGGCVGELIMKLENLQVVDSLGSSDNLVRAVSEHAYAAAGLLLASHQVHRVLTSSLGSLKKSDLASLNESFKPYMHSLNGIPDGSVDEALARDLRACVAFPVSLVLLSFALHCVKFRRGTDELNGPEDGLFDGSEAIAQDENNATSPSAAYTSNTAATVSSLIRRALRYCDDVVVDRRFVPISGLAADPTKSLPGLGITRFLTKPSTDDKMLVGLWELRMLPQSERDPAVDSTSLYEDITGWPLELLPSSERAIRAVLYDFLECIVFSVDVTDEELHLTPLFQFLSIMCSVDEALATKAFIGRDQFGVLQVWDTFTYIDQLQDRPLSHRDDLDRDILKWREKPLETLWRKIVSEYLLTYLPYSLPLLLEFAIPFIPATDGCSRLSDAWGRVRYTFVTKDFLKPLRTFCSPPVLGMGHATMHRNTNGNHSGFARAPQSDTFSLFNYEAESDGDYEARNTYELTEPASIKDLLLAGINISVNLKCILPPGTLGSVSEMPVELPNAYFIGCGPGPDREPRLYRRYKGFVWAKNVVTSQLDASFDSCDDITSDGPTSKKQSSRAGPPEFEDLSRGPRAPYTVKWVLPSNAPSLLGVVVAFFRGLITSVQEEPSDDMQLELLRLNLLTIIATFISTFMRGGPALEFSYADRLPIRVSANETYPLRLLIERVAAVEMTDWLGAPLGLMREYIRVLNLMMIVLDRVGSANASLILVCRMCVTESLKALRVLTLPMPFGITRVLVATDFIGDAATFCWDVMENPAPDEMLPRDGPNYYKNPYAPSDAYSVPFHWFLLCAFQRGANTNTNHGNARIYNTNFGLSLSFRNLCILIRLLGSTGAVGAMGSIGAAGAIGSTQSDVFRSAVDLVSSLLKVSCMGGSETVCAFEDATGSLRAVEAAAMELNAAQERMSGDWSGTLTLIQAMQTQLVDIVARAHREPGLDCETKLFFSQIVELFLPMVWTQIFAATNSWTLATRFQVSIHHIGLLQLVLRQLTPSFAAKGAYEKTASLPQTSFFDHILSDSSSVIPILIRLLQFRVGVTCENTVDEFLFENPFLLEHAYFQELRDSSESQLSYTATVTLGRQVLDASTHFVLGLLETIDFGTQSEVKSDNCDCFMHSPPKASLKMFGEKFRRFCEDSTQSPTSQKLGATSTRSYLTPYPNAVSPGVWLSSDDEWANASRASGLQMLVGVPGAYELLDLHASLSIYASWATKPLFLIVPFIVLGKMQSMPSTLPMSMLRSKDEFESGCEDRKADDFIQLAHVRPLWKEARKTRLLPRSQADQSAKKKESEWPTTESEQAVPSAENAEETLKDDFELALEICFSRLLLFNNVTFSQFLSCDGYSLHHLWAGTLLDNILSTSSNLFCNLRFQTKTKTLRVGDYLLGVSLEALFQVLQHFRGSEICKAALPTLTYIVNNIQKSGPYIASKLCGLWGSLLHDWAFAPSTVKAQESKEAQGLIGSTGWDLLGTLFNVVLTHLSNLDQSQDDTQNQTVRKIPYTASSISKMLRGVPAKIGCSNSPVTPPEVMPLITLTLLVRIVAYSVPHCESSEIKLGMFPSSNATEETVKTNFADYLKLLSNITLEDKPAEVFFGQFSSVSVLPDVTETSHLLRDWNALKSQVRASMPGTLCRHCQAAIAGLPPTDSLGLIDCNFNSDSKSTSDFRVLFDLAFQAHLLPKIPARKPHTAYACYDAKKVMPRIILAANCWGNKQVLQQSRIADLANAAFSGDDLPISAQCVAWDRLFECLNKIQSTIMKDAAKKMMLLALVDLLRIARQQQVFPLLFPPDGEPRSAEKSMRLRKPFMVYLPHVSRILTTTLRENRGLWSKGGCMFSCPEAAVTFDCSEISFGSLILDFLLNLLTANWEGDCRASGVLNHTAASQVTDSSEANSKTGNCISRSFIAPMPHHDGLLGRSGCLSTLQQQHVALTRPAIFHPDAGWLRAPLGQLIVPCPSIDFVDMQDTKDRANISADQSDAAPRGQRRPSNVPKLVISLSVPAIVSSPGRLTLDDLTALTMALWAVVKTSFTTLLRAAATLNDVPVTIDLDGNPFPIADLGRCATLLMVLTRTVITSIIHGGSQETIDPWLLEYFKELVNMFIEMTAVEVPFNRTWTAMFLSAIMTQRNHDSTQKSMIKKSKQHASPRALPHLAVPSIVSTLLIPIIISALFHTAVDAVKSGLAFSVTAFSREDETGNRLTAAQYLESLVSQNLTHPTKLLSNVASSLALLCNTTDVIQLPGCHADMTSEAMAGATSAACRVSHSLFSTLMLLVGFSPSLLRAFLAVPVGHIFCRLPAMHLFLKSLTREDSSVFPSSDRIGTLLSLSGNGDNWCPLYYKSNHNSVHVAQRRSPMHLEWCRVLLIWLRTIRMMRSTTCALAHSENISSLRDDEKQATDISGPALSLFKSARQMLPAANRTFDDTLAVWRTAVTRPEVAEKARCGHVAADLMLTFESRFISVLDHAFRGTTELAVIEEVACVGRLLAELPDLQSFATFEEKVRITQLMRIAVRTAASLAAGALKKGRLESGESFRPVTTAEMRSADVPTGFSTTVQVPSIFHQRVVLLILRFANDVLVSMLNLDFPGVDLVELQNVSCFINHRDPFGPTLRTARPNSAPEQKVTTILEVEACAHMLETFLQDVADLGAVGAQTLEDVHRLDKAVFVGVKPANTAVAGLSPNSSDSVILPLSLNLRAEGRLMGAAASFSGMQLSHSRSRSSSVNGSTSPLPGGHESSEIGTPPDPHFRHGSTVRSSLGILADSATILSRRTSSPLVQQYIAGTPLRHHSTRNARYASPVDVYANLLRAEIGEGDAVEGLLPEFVTYGAVLDLMRQIVESSLHLTLLLFGRLRRNNAANAGTAKYEELQPAAVRRLLEFCGTLLNSRLWQGKSDVLRLIQRVMTFLSGDNMSG